MYDDLQNWLCTEAQRRNIHATFYMERAQARNGWLKLPARIEGDALDFGDRANLLQELEDSWNDQEPKPNPLVVLEPAKR